jgi:hypothetical protein
MILSYTYDAALFVSIKATFSEKKFVTPFEYWTQRAVTLRELREWYDENLLNMSPARWMVAQALVICKLI